MANGGWTGPVQRDTHITEVQAMLDDMGGAREKRAPVARLGFIDVWEEAPEARNVACAFAADGTVLAQWGWRPVYDMRNHGNQALFWKHDGLFICG